MEACSNPQLNLMEANKFILMKVLPLNLKTKADGFLKPFIQFPQGFRLCMAALEVGNDADVETIFILFNDDRKRVVLHAWSVARKRRVGQGVLSIVRCSHQFIMAAPPGRP